jgi:hypothetical protein
MDRFNFFFRQKVTEGELDAAFTAVEDALKDWALDNGVVGITSGAAVSENAGTPNLTVDVGGPASIYNQNGNRVTWTGTQDVNCAVDENSNPTAVAAPGNEKWLTIFADYVQVQSDPRLDGDGNTVFYELTDSFALRVVQGAEAVIPTATRPALRASQILLADVRLVFGTTQVFNADISTLRREWAIKTTSGTAVACGTVEAAVQALATAIATSGTDLAAHKAAVTKEHNATAVEYASSPTWHDGTTLTVPESVEQAIDEIIVKLADVGTFGLGGGDKIGIEGQTVGLATVANGSLYDQIGQLLTDIDMLKRTGTVGSKARASNFRMSAMVSSGAGVNVQAVAMSAPPASTHQWGAVAEAVGAPEVRYSNEGPLSGWQAGAALPGTCDRIRAIAYSPTLNLWVVAGRVSAALGAYIATGTTLAGLTERTATGMLAAGDQIESLIWDPVGAQFIAGGAAGKIITSANGTAWAASTTPGGAVEVVDLAVNPDTGTLVAAVRTGGNGQAWRSVNSGATWTLNATLTGSDARCCCFDEVGGFFWIGCESSKVWRAAATGSGWTDQSPGAMPTADTADGIAAADDGLVLANMAVDREVYTMDGGTTWGYVGVDTEDGSPAGGSWGPILRFIGGRFVQLSSTYVLTSLIGGAERDVS